VCTCPSPASHSPETAAGSIHTGLEYATGLSPRRARTKYQGSSADARRTARSAPPLAAATTFPPLVTSSSVSAGSLTVAASSSFAFGVRSSRLPMPRPSAENVSRSAFSSGPTA
jgi:hypothetical protein